MALKKIKKVSAAGGSAFGGKKAARKLTKKPLKKKSKPAAKKMVKKPAKKLLKKKISKKIPAAKKPAKASAKPEGTLIGIVTHYFPHVQAAVIKLKAPLTIGDTIKIKGHTTDITQVVSSMQIDRVDITSAKKGDEIGLQVSSRARQDDEVYKI